MRRKCPLHVDPPSSTSSSSTPTSAAAAVDASETDWIISYIIQVYDNTQLTSKKLLLIIIIISCCCATAAAWVTAEILYCLSPRPNERTNERMRSYSFKRRGGEKKNGTGEKNAALPFQMGGFVWGADDGSLLYGARRVSSRGKGIVLIGGSSSSSGIE